MGVPNPNQVLEMKDGSFAFSWYNFQVKYKPGLTDQSDFLSRHPSINNNVQQSKMVDEYVNFIVQHAIPKSMTLDEIREATEKDRVLKALRAAIRLNPSKMSYQLMCYT